MNEQQRISLLRLLIVGVSSSLLVVGGFFLLFAAYEADAWFFWMSQRHLDQDTLFGVGRNAVTLAAALGVGVTLFFSYRKQQTAENAQELAVKDQNMALESQRLATETLQLSLDKHELETTSELRNRYARSAEQLANEKDAIQLAGIHSLASLADDWARIGNQDEQQVCISLLCSYIGLSVPTPEEPFDISTTTATDIVLSRLTLNPQNLERYWGARQVTITHGLTRSSLIDLRIVGGHITFKKCKATAFYRFKIESGRLDFIGLQGGSVPRFKDSRFSGGSAHLRNDSVSKYEEFIFVDCEFTGTAVLIFTRNTEGSTIIFEKCYFSSGNVRINLSTSIARVSFIDCTFASPDVVRIFSLSLDKINLDFEDCKFIKSGTLMQEKPEDTLLNVRHEPIQPEFFYNA